MKTSIDLIAPASAATAELHRRFCSDVPNDGTYTLHLNETETIRFFAEADRLIAAHCAAATAKERQARELAEGEIKDIAKDRLALFRATYAWVADIEAEAGGVGSGNIHGIYCKAKAAVMGSPLYEEMNIAREATNFDTP